jgi:hypothetical protein
MLSAYTAVVIVMLYSMAAQILTLLADSSQCRNLLSANFVLHFFDCNPWPTKYMAYFVK